MARNFSLLSLELAALHASLKLADELYSCDLSNFDRHFQR